MTRLAASTHPAPFSTEVLALFAWAGPPRTSRVHDPFAGAGDRLGTLADQQGWAFTGTELEAPFIVDPRVTEGNACDPGSYPRKGYHIITSPTYPNGIADNFNAQDASERRTYRSARAKITGADQPLHSDNQGRWGYRGTPIHSPTRAVYWAIARRAVANWKGAAGVYLNVSDFMVKDRVEPVVAGWVGVLEGAGWRIERAYPVVTRRYRNGAGRAARVANEVVVHAVRRT